eukprot:3935233-Rhodomonas_salina.1
MPVVLHTCYGLSGTDVGYGATRKGSSLRGLSCLRQAKGIWDSWTPQLTKEVSSKSIKRSEVPGAKCQGSRSFPFDFAVCVPRRNRLGVSGTHAHAICCQQVRAGSLRLQRARTGRRWWRSVCCVPTRSFIATRVLTRMYAAPWKEY